VASVTGFFVPTLDRALHPWHLPPLLTSQDVISFEALDRLNCGTLRSK
jgi:hypothetical protein